MAFFGACHMTGVGVGGAINEADDKRANLGWVK
jgi:hypothetical protein